MKNFVLKGNVCYSKDIHTLHTLKDAYIVCLEGKSEGVFEKLPEKYLTLPLIDYGNHIIIPGLTDLHVHAPQFSFRGMGMDLELLDWLDSQTFPEESKYKDITYAKEAYSLFVNDMKRGPNTRACMFGTIHVPATLELMGLLEDSGLVTMVGKVNMDRNSPDSLREASAESSIRDTEQWLSSCKHSFKNTTPILTPRFIPSCTDELMTDIKALQQKYQLPVQSHLSENPSEVSWVKELCPKADSYGEAYEQFGLFGGDTKTIMAHCVWSEEAELALMKKNCVYIAHCPQSNMNLSSGIAPIRRFLEQGAKIGLGSDVAGGCHTSILRAMADAIQVSKMHWRLTEAAERPLTLEEVFYMATIGGGAFFGKVGSFDAGYEFDAVVLKDDGLSVSNDLPIRDRMERLTYLADDRNIAAKYVQGVSIL